MQVHAMRGRSMWGSLNAVAPTTHLPLCPRSQRVRGSGQACANQTFGPTSRGSSGAVPAGTCRGEQGVSAGPDAAKMGQKSAVACGEAPEIESFVACGVCGDAWRAERGAVLLGCRIFDLATAACFGTHLHFGGDAGAHWRGGDVTHDTSLQNTPL